MALIKNPSVNIRLKYKRVMEFSLITALVLVISAFKFFPEIKSPARVSEFPPEIIKVEDIQSTKQEMNHPRNERPTIPANIIPDDNPVDIELPPIDFTNERNIIPLPDVTKGRIIVEETLDFLPVAEVMPEPLGGIRAIQEKVIYPEISKRAGIEGKVYVLAYINESGDVTRTEILKGVEGLNEAASTAVKETKFKPGMQRDKPVKVKITIPIVFRLN